jgi:hypothetical protein
MRRGHHSSSVLKAMGSADGEQVEPAAAVLDDSATSESE